MVKLWWTWSTLVWVSSLLQRGSHGWLASSLPLSKLGQQKSPQKRICKPLSYSLEEQDDEKSTLFQGRRDFLQHSSVAMAWTLSCPPVWAAAVSSSVSTDPDPAVFEFLEQFYTVDDVPQSYFSDHRFIYGFVERVIDGDTIRIRHVPGYGFGRKAPQPLQQRGIANETLSIRIYAVDSPETGKNKRKTSQPFGDEAEAFTKDLVLHRMVKITFLRRDQYRRAVAQVETVEEGLLSKPKDLSMELAKQGLAEMYTGGGAEYNGNKDDIQKAIDRAKKQKKGIWSLDNRVSAAEYKRAQRDGTPVPVASTTNTQRLPQQETKSPRLVSSSEYRTPTKASRNNAIHNLLDVAVTGLELTPM